MYDPLTVITDDGGWKPYLAESVTPNADNTVWTIKVRPGVTFHDGTPLDGAAVVENLTRAKNGFLTGTALADVTNIAVNPTDPLAADVTVKRPWTSFPLYLAGQIGMIASPTWLKASDSDDALKAKPVGTGPFIFESYAPNESFKAKRNPNYWNKPYPYLDEIEFRPIADALNRRDALEERRRADHPHDERADHRRRPQQQGLRARRAHVQGPDQLHPDARHPGPAGRHAVAAHRPAGALRAGQRLRRQDDHRHDRRRASTRIANGPFSPQQVGYLEGHAATRRSRTWTRPRPLIADYKKEHPGPLNLSLATTQDDTNLTIAQFQKQWWEEAGVDSVTIDQIDQGNFIVTALLGNFQVFQWRNHSGVDLDEQYIWWHSSTALPVGQLALNFGRIKDPVIDQALDANRGETDPAKKQEYAETVNKRFAEQCYDLWSSWTTWAELHDPKVQVPASDTLPDGSTSTPTNEIVNVRDLWIAAVARAPRSRPSAGRVRGEKPRWGVVDAVSMSPYLAEQAAVAAVTAGERGLRPRSGEPEESDRGGTR